jgi:hypothetical protein
MLRTALAGLLAVPAALAVAPPSLASPTDYAVSAHVDESGPRGQEISLSRGGQDAGHLTLTRCANGSQTSFFCAGTGTVSGLGPAKVRIRWRCPIDGPCQGRGEGTLKNHGNTLALLHVRASVPRVQDQGATFRIRVELVPE